MKSLRSKVGFNDTSSSTIAFFLDGSHAFQVDGALAPILRALCRGTPPTIATATSNLSRFPCTHPVTGNAASTDILLQALHVRLLKELKQLASSSMASL